MIGFLRSKLDRITSMKASTTILLIAVALAGSVSFISWGPLRWFLQSFIPADAAGGWVASLIITIGLGWVGGICIPFAILVIGLVIWAHNS